MANNRIDDLRKRLEKEPGSRLFAQLAEELRKDGELAEAIQVCRDGLAQHPNYPSARMTLGRALLDRGDLPEARKELEAVLQGAPDNILASRLLAESLEGMGDFQGALARYRATLAMAPEDKLSQARQRELERRLGGAPSAQAGAEPVAAPRAAASATEEPTAPPPAGPSVAIPVMSSEEEFELEEPYESPAMRWTPPPSFAPEATAGPPPPAEAPASAGFAFEADLADEAPAASPSPPAEGAPGDESLASATLAELYFTQGMTQRAVEVYRQVLAREPGNPQARARLAELEGREGDAAERKRRTIARLEALLAAVARRRPA